MRPKDVFAVKGLARQVKLKEAAEAGLGINDVERTFLRLIEEAWKPFHAVMPDPAGGPRGFDAGKKLKGRKRHSWPTPTGARW